MRKEKIEAVKKLAAHKAKKAGSRFGQMAAGLALLLAGREMIIYDATGGAKLRPETFEMASVLPEILPDGMTFDDVLPAAMAQGKAVKKPLKPKASKSDMDVLREAGLTEEGDAK